MKAIPGVLTIHRFLSPRTCAQLKGIYDEHYRTSTNKDYTMNPVLHLFDLRRTGKTVEYEFFSEQIVKVREAVRASMGIEGPLYVEAAFLARLPEGGRHPLHRDNCTDDGRPNHTPQRDYSSLVYLNSNFEGGKIIFPSRGEIQPKAGLLVAFPSGRDFPHEVPAVMKGQRYSMPIWFSLQERYNMFGGRS